MPLTKAQIKQGMDCVIVGGCASGIVLQKIRMDAEYIELNRPTYIKPLEAAHAMPEAAKESDVYEIHPITLINDDRKQAIFGIGVIEGKSLTWAFSQLVTGYVENTTQKMIAAGIVTSQ